VAFSLINAKALRKAYVMSLEIPRTVTVHGTSSTHKLASQFGGLENKETLSTKVKAVVYQSLTTQEFEERWLQLMIEIGYENDRWFNELFNIRAKWAHI
jgi:hypothetical protein